MFDALEARSDDDDDCIVEARPHVPNTRKKVRLTDDSGPILLSDVTLLTVDDDDTTVDETM